MNVTKIPSASAYRVSASISPNDLIAPSMTYWIWVQNHDQLTSESEKYSIGVMPRYDIKGTIELVMSQNVPEGTTQSPTIYVTNSANGPIYGIISLLVDGNQTTIFPA